MQHDKGMRSIFLSIRRLINCAPNLEVKNEGVLAMLETTTTSDIRSARAGLSCCVKLVHLNWRSIGLTTYACGHLDDIMPLLNVAMGIS